MVYATSDLHGYPLAKFQELLTTANFGDDDFCFVLGDVIDRGADGISLLRWFMMQPNIQLILGNHEAMMLSCKTMFGTLTHESWSDINENQQLISTWMVNGALPTIDQVKQLQASDPELLSDLLDYLQEAPLYDTVDIQNRHFLLTHSGLANFDRSKSIDDYTPDELLWNRPAITDRYFDNVLTVFGHTPTHFYGKEYQGKALVTPTWVDIDTGAPHGAAPMLLRLDDMKEFYI